MVRGRVLVEPGASSAHLAGVNIRDITPALVGEEVAIGPHRLIVEHIVVREPVKSRDGFAEMVGASDTMKRLFGILSRMAAHDAPVLVIGESGTGKELTARGLHDGGPRACLLYTSPSPRD